MPQLSERGPTLASVERTPSRIPLLFGEARLGWDLGAGNDSPALVGPRGDLGCQGETFPGRKCARENWRTFERHVGIWVPNANYIRILWVCPKKSALWFPFKSKDGNPLPSTALADSQLPGTGVPRKSSAPQNFWWVRRLETCASWHLARDSSHAHHPLSCLLPAKKTHDTVSIHLTLTPQHSQLVGRIVGRLEQHSFRLPSLCPQFEVVSTGNENRRKLSVQVASIPHIVLFA